MDEGGRRATKTDKLLDAQCGATNISEIQPKFSLEFTLDICFFVPLSINILQGMQQKE